MSDRMQALIEFAPDTEDYSKWSNAELAELLKVYQGGKLEPLEAEICRRLTQDNYAIKEEHNGR